MHGTVYLKSIQEVAEFLAAFSETGATDVFVVHFVSNGTGYAISFNGAK